MNPLSERELEVARLVREGVSVKRIAIILQIDASTAYSHIANIAAKIDGSSKPYIRVLVWAQKHLPE